MTRSESQKVRYTEMGNFREKMFKLEKLGTCLEFSGQVTTRLHGATKRIYT